MIVLDIKYPVAREDIKAAHELAQFNGCEINDGRISYNGGFVWAKDFPESWIEEVRTEVNWELIKSGAKAQVKLHSGEWEDVEFFQTTKDGRFLAWTDMAYKFYVYDEIRPPQNYKGGQEAWEEEFCTQPVTSDLTENSLEGLVDDSKASCIHNALECAYNQCENCPTKEAKNEPYPNFIPGLYSQSTVF